MLTKQEKSPGSGGGYSGLWGFPTGDHPGQAGEGDAHNAQRSGASPRRRRRGPMVALRTKEATQ